MSAFLLGIGFRADMGTCVRKLVLLKLIDACEDDGTRIFPAIATIARAAQCSTRQVQRELRAFLDAGLITVVKEGGKGPRSTTEYALDLDLLTRLGREGWATVVNGAASDKGDTVSPLEDEEKGDSGDPLRVTSETDKGDKLCHPTPPDPSPDPSIEREARARGQEGQTETAESRKVVERAFERAWQRWPTSVSDSRPAAWKAWLGLSADERTAAAADMDRWLEANRTSGRRLVPAFGSYLAGKRWENLPPPSEPRPVALDAPAFGPLWMAARLKQFALVPPATPAGLTAVERMLVESGKANLGDLMRGKRVRDGWPAVNRMHERARFGQGVAVAPELEPLAALMEPVPVGSERYAEWEVEHERRGWPWLPDPGAQRVVYFPAGGPGEGMRRFEQAVRGEDDAGERKAVGA